MYLLINGTELLSIFVFIPEERIPPLPKKDKRRMKLQAYAQL
jgi:hypothetical protein